MVQQCRQQQEPTEANPAFTPNRSRNPRRLRRGGCQPTDDQLIAERIERLEIRAFGCLLEELAERCHVVSSEQQKIIGCLDDLTLSCLNENILLRPDFDEITRFLQGLMREYEVITAPQAFA